MLNPKYRYIWIDFETTWLDVNKDEPIQIWIVELDHNLKIIDKFESLIKPTKDISELKSIVGFITWLNISDLKDSPWVENIWKQIEKFSWENVVLIWHNVDFDLSFLKKFFPDFKFKYSIDTLAWMRNFVHYAPSYALDVLIKRVQNDKVSKNIDLNREWLSDTESAHDALCDTQNALGFFVYTINYILELKKNYPVLNYFLVKHSLFSELFGDIDYLEFDNIILDKLEKIWPANTSFKNNIDTIDLEKLENIERYYIGDVWLKDILQWLLVNKKIVLSFSSKNKMDIAKAILNDIWIKNIWFAKEDQTINYDNFYQFLNKKKWDDDEVLFVLKYVSHLYQWYGVLDLNSKSDFQIYYFIKDYRESVRYPVILTTHWGLFSLIEENRETYYDYNILFFDVEWWYKSYNNYLSRPCDLYYILNLIEMYMYKYKLGYQLGLNGENILNELENFYNFFQIFIWEIFIETKTLFRDKPNPNIQINPIIDNLDFVKTNALIKQFETYKSIFGDLLWWNFKIFWAGIDHMLEIFGEITAISKKMYNQSDFYFIYSEVNKFTNWSEFTEKFQDFKMVFLSNYEKNYKNIKETFTPNLKEFKSNIDIQRLSTIPRVAEFRDNLDYDNTDCVFILSTKKDESKALFDFFVSKWIDKQYLMLIENITWWFGKNIFKAKSDWKKILVGWYNFLMSCYSNKVNIDKLIVFNIKWSQEKYILADIERYAYQNYFKD